jgi:hypothetical protein
MSAARQIDRRTVLRGLGTTIALPFLEIMLPGRTYGLNAKPPVRMAFIFAPNGKHMPDWTPASEGVLDKLPSSLQPLDAVKSEILQLSGLQLSTEGAEVCGGHSCTVGQFLTCVLPKRTLATDLRAGISVDQMAASAIGHHTRFPSMELGCVPSKYSGDCDSGYSCVYTTHISWRTPTSPLPKEVDPRAVFDRLFGTDLRTAGGARHSILDHAREEALRLHRRLGMSDRRKLDEYLYSLREVERRIQGAENAQAGKLSPEAGPPSGIPRDRDEHIRLMLDMIVLAFQTDSTRVLTFMIGNGSDNRSFPQIGISGGHHNLSHHVGSAKKQAQLSRINHHYVTHLRYLIDRLRAVQEAEGTLLDNSMILYGCAFGDGNSHDETDLPILIAGRGGGAIRPGRHIRLEKGTPLANLYLTLLDNVGAPAERLGNSSGRLEGLGG